jgi:hypothetical protein
VCEFRKVVDIDLEVGLYIQVTETRISGLYDFSGAQKKETHS